MERIMCKDDKEALIQVYERTRLDKKYLLAGLETLHLPDDARILDVGCGPGASTEIIRESYPNADLYGVDNSIQSIQYARLSKYETIKYINADASCMPFPDGHFDCCVAKMLFDIVKNPEEILKEMIRVLNPFGILLIYGNVRSTAQGSPCLKNADKLIRAYERYSRLSGWRGFDVEYLKMIITKQYKMSVRVQKIIKDTNNPGREALLRYYVLPKERIKEGVNRNVLVRVGLVSPEEIIEYENSLRELLLSQEYLFFEQAIIYATR